MSRRTTSGESAATCANTVSPSAASPTTDRSGSVPRISRSPVRTSSSSSTGIDGSRWRAGSPGDAVLAPSVTRRVVDELTRCHAQPAIIEMRQLTERERDVLSLMAQGLSNGEIGQHLFISEGTVKTHVARILAKLGVCDRLQAVVLAFQSGAVN